MQGGKGVDSHFNNLIFFFLCSSLKNHTIGDDRSDELSLAFP